MAEFRVPKKLDEFDAAESVRCHTFRLLPPEVIYRPQDNDVIIRPRED